MKPQTVYGDSALVAPVTFKYNLQVRARALRNYLLLQAPVMSLNLFARQVFGHLGGSM